MLEPDCAPILNAKVLSTLSGTGHKAQCYEFKLALTLGMKEFISGHLVPGLIKKKCCWDGAPVLPGYCMDIAGIKHIKGAFY